MTPNEPINDTTLSNQLQQSNHLPFEMKQPDDAAGDEQYQQGYDDCLKEHGAIFKGQKPEDTVVYKLGYRAALEAVIKGLPEKLQIQQYTGRNGKTIENDPDIDAKEGWNDCIDEMNNRLAELERHDLHK